MKTFPFLVSVLVALALFAGSPARAEVWTLSVPPAQLCPGAEQRQFHHDLYFDGPEFRLIGGEPVSGWANLYLCSDGRFRLEANIRATGLTSHDACFVFVVRSSSGKLITFAPPGKHAAGTLEPGSRDASWNETGKIPALAEHWEEFSAATSEARGDVSLDVGGLLEQVKGAISTAQGVSQVFLGR